MNNIEKIKQRLKDIETDLDEDGINKVIYYKTSKILLSILPEILFIESPILVGATNEGRIIVEYHDYKQIVVLAIIIIDEDNFSIKGLKTNNHVFNIDSNRNNIKITLKGVVDAQ